jgi:hypothetical protein
MPDNKADEPTKIASKMSAENIRLYRECKAFYDECKKKGIMCTVEDCHHNNPVAKHEYWLAFLNSPLKRFIIEGRVVIHPDDEQLSVELLDESMPDDEEHRELLLTIVSTTISNLYNTQRKSSGMEVEDLFDNESHPVSNMQRGTCFVSGNDNSLIIKGDVNAGNVKKTVKCSLGGLM